MEGDLSKTTVWVLLVLAITISLISTWILLDSAVNSTDNSIKDTTTGYASLEQSSATGKVSLTIVSSNQTNQGNTR